MVLLLSACEKKQPEEGLHIVMAAIGPVDASIPDAETVTSLGGELEYVGGLVRLAGAPDRIGMVGQGTAIWVRTYGAAPLDVTEKFRRIDPMPTLRAIRHGEAAVFSWHELVARPARGAARYQYKARLITWDAAAGRPTVTERYDCDETRASCEPPEWLLAD